MKIVLDADGVLLDYNARMAQVSQTALDIKLKKIKNAHHFYNCYGVSFSKEQWSKVYSLFDQEGWNKMPEIQGATQAVKKLKEQGHELICVSSMPSKFINDRKKNFIYLGMPINTVIGCDRDEEKNGFNPKAKYLNELKPDIFIDDQLRNFKDIDEKICKIWINNNFDDCPNVNEDRALCDFSFNSLIEFVNMFTVDPNKFNKSLLLNKKSIKVRN